MYVAAILIAGVVLAVVVGILAGGHSPRLYWRVSLGVGDAITILAAVIALPFLLVYSALAIISGVIARLARADNQTTTEKD